MGKIVVMDRSLGSKDCEGSALSTVPGYIYFNENVLQHFQLFCISVLNCKCYKSCSCLRIKVYDGWLTVTLRVKDTNTDFVTNSVALLLIYVSWRLENDSRNGKPGSRVVSQSENISYLIDFWQDLLQCVLPIYLGASGIWDTLLVQLLCVSYLFVRVPQRPKCLLCIQSIHDIKSNVDWGWSHVGLSAFTHSQN